MNHTLLISTPVTRHSLSKPAIETVPKFTTATTCRPSSSSFSYSVNPAADHSVSVPKSTSSL
jgi:hypothetical protein